MRTLLNDRDQKELIDRLSKVRPDSQRRWASISAHSDLPSQRFLPGGTGQEAGQFFLDTLEANNVPRLCACLSHGHGIKTHPEVDQQQGGTRPLAFSSDVESFRILSGQLCGCKHEFAVHAMFGQLSTTKLIASPTRMLL